MKKRLLAFTLCCALTASLAACAQNPATSASSSPDASVIRMELPEGAPEDAKVHTAEEGVQVIDPASPVSEIKPEAAQIPVTPETVWTQAQDIPHRAYTVPDKAALDEEGCIGILSIPAIELEVKAIDPEGADMLSVMDRGAAHFASSSAWDGNVALSAHNATADGSPAHFKDLHKLKEGDPVFYTTALGERSYEVSVIKEIADNDLSYVQERPDENQITLITCITGQPEKRLMVRAVEVEP